MSGFTLFLQGIRHESQKQGASQKHGACSLTGPDTSAHSPARYLPARVSTSHPLWKVQQVYGTSKVEIAQLLHSSAEAACWQHVEVPECIDSTSSIP